MNNKTVVRAALLFLSLGAAQIGFWALLAPRSFYDSFPGLGRAWVSLDGPYNEHLIRDVGALNLALLTVLLAAAIWCTRELVMMAAVASAAWNVPHLLYHLFNTEPFSTGDLIISLTALFASAAFSAALFVVARNPAFAANRS